METDILSDVGNYYVSSDDANISFAQISVDSAKKITANWWPKKMKNNLVLSMTAKH